MAARRFTVILCWGVAQERDVLNLVGREPTGRRQQLLRELATLGASEASTTPPAVAPSGEPCEAHRVVLHLHPNLQADAVTIGSLESVPVSRRNEWLRHLLIVGNNVSRRGLRAPLATTTCDIELDIQVESQLQEFRRKPMSSVTAITSSPLHATSQQFLRGQDIPSADDGDLAGPNDIPACISEDAAAVPPGTGRPKLPGLLSLFQ